MKTIRSVLYVRRGNRWTFSACNSRPQTGSLHPMAIEVGLFLRLGIFLRLAGRHQFGCRELSVKNARFEQLRLVGSTPNSADYNRDGDDSR
jgi:hypothetical protein